MINNQRGAKRRVGYNHFIFGKPELKGWHSFRMDRSTFINMHFSKVISIVWFETSPWRSSAQPETDPGTHLVCSGGHISLVAWYSTKNDTLLRESVDWFTLNFKHCSKEEWYLTGINRNFLLDVCRFDSSDRLESWGSHSFKIPATTFSCGTCWRLQSELEERNVGTFNN